VTYQTAVLNRAKEIANAQGRLASSPAERSSDGRLVLCAASCIALAAIEQNSAVISAAEFGRRVLTEDKATFIPSLFEAHGLGAERARNAMRENDNRDPSARLPWFNTLDAI
jgi:hypothetical protein